MKRIHTHAWRLLEFDFGGFASWDCRCKARLFLGVVVCPVVLPTPSHFKIKACWRYTRVVTVDFKAEKIMREVSHFAFGNTLAVLAGYEMMRAMQMVKGGGA